MAKPKARAAGGKTVSVELNRDELKNLRWAVDSYIMRYDSELPPPRLKMLSELDDKLESAQASL